MKIQLAITGLFLLLLSSCGPTITKIISKSEPGQAIIQHENGKFSRPMTTREGFGELQSNEKLYLSPGKVELTEPLKLSHIHHFQIIGNKTSLVAKIDMPVVTFENTDYVSLTDLFVVHEIGGWCAQNCIEFNGASNVRIEKCTFDGSGYFGLALTSVQDAHIVDNKFFNCEYGLATWKCKGLMVKNNRFSKNRRQDIMANETQQFANDFAADNTFE